jgi:hypothetical protein
LPRVAKLIEGIRLSRLAGAGVAGLIALVCTTGTALGQVVSVGQDASTMGNWPSKYGSCDFVLFGQKVAVGMQTPVCNPNTIDPTTGMHVVCPNPQTPPLQIFPEPGGNYNHGATPDLQDCRGNTSGTGAFGNITYAVRLCGVPNPPSFHAIGTLPPGYITFNGAQFPPNAQGFNWGCNTGNPGALLFPSDMTHFQVPPGNCNTLGAGCGVAPVSNIASTVDDAAETLCNPPAAPVGLCIDLDLSSVPAAANGYVLSAYFLDFDGGGHNVCGQGGPRTEDVDLFLGNGALVPGSSQTVTDFGTGKYINWTLNPLPPQLTINVDRGANTVNAVLSALFLDKVGDTTCSVPQTGSFTLTKNPKGAHYNIGDNINFTMVTASTGPGTAQAVTLNDPLPTLGNLNTWAISSDPTGLCTIAANVLHCAYGDLANGQSRTVTVTTTAAGGANAAACPGGVTLNNTATVTSTGLQPKTDTGDYTCSPGSFTIVKTPKGASYSIGQNINFQMVTTSTGPGTAKAVTLNDPLPTLGNLNTWIITSDPTGLCTIVGNTLNCPYGDLANGQSRTVTVATNAAGGANASACPGGQTLNNTATVTSTGLQPKTDTGDYTCSPQPGSFTIVKTPKGATYNIGQNISFSMVTASTGPGTAKAVTLNDPLPTLGNLNTWVITSDPTGLCTIVGNTLNCPYGDLANGQTRTVMVATNAVGGANAAACPGGVTLNNTATVTSTGLQPKTDTGDYTCTPPGSFTLVKSPKGATYNIGQNISFSMVTTSTGPGTAKAVTLNDPLPTLGNLNTWVISSDPTGLCTIAANVLHCAYGDLANGQSRTVMVATNASGGANAAACPGGVTLNNTATVTSTGLQPKTDTGDYTCTPPGSFTLVKSPKGATYSIGQNISFSMVTTSTGPGTAKAVTLNDPLPTLGNLNTWVISSDPTGLCTIAANTLNCPYGDLANGQTRTVMVSTNASGGANASACPGNVTLNNTATVTSTGLPPKSDTGDYTCRPGKPITIGPSSMEGSIRISNGDFVNGGFSLKTNFTAPIFVSGTVTLTGPCSNGGTATVVVPIQAPINAVSGADWLPTGDANSVLSWQGAALVGGNANTPPGTVGVPAICGGTGQMDASKGAVYNATVSGVPAGGHVTFRFKYRDPFAKGKPNTNCLDTSDPNRARADVCGASWSQTVTDP